MNWLFGEYICFDTSDLIDENGRESAGHKALILFSFEDFTTETS